MTFILILLVSSCTVVFKTVDKTMPNKIRQSNLNVMYNIYVKFDTSRHAINGITEIRFVPGDIEQVDFLLNRGFIIDSLVFNHQRSHAAKLQFYKDEDRLREIGADSSKAACWKFYLSQELQRDEYVSLTLFYRGTLYTPSDNRQFSRERIAFEIDGTISNEGIYLSPSAYWYPRLPDKLAKHHVHASLPFGWDCVTDGKSSKVSEQGDLTEVLHSSKQLTEALSFSAGPYVVKSEEHNGVLIMTYMLPPQADLADGYIQACKRYLDMYSEMIAPYPFPKFAVVDNFIPSGYGMPGWTLLGSEVLRLPFIKHTSLGHEILHNWFGNSLYVDYDGGNWCEGSTVYLADYRYKADSDSLSAVDYLMNQLRDYTSYVNPDNDYPLTQFLSRNDPRDRAIGYGKAMMVFHMLKRMLEARENGLFMKTIRTIYQEHQWSPVSWQDWEEAFTNSYGEDMSRFFDGWVEQSGAPEISLQDVSVQQTGNRWVASFKVQTEPVDMEYVYPLTLRTGFTEDWYFDSFTIIQHPVHEITLEGEGSLENIQLDPGFDVFRKIYPGETPVTLAAFMGDPDGVFVLPSGGPHVEAYRKVAEGLKTDDQTIVADLVFSEGFDGTYGIEYPSAWILGGPGENSAWDHLPKPDQAKLAVIDEESVRSIYLNEKKVEGNGITVTASFPDYQSASVCKSIVYTIATPNSDPVAGTRKLTHYGKYSYLAFDGDKNIAKGTWKSTGDSPMVWRRGE